MMRFKKLGAALLVLVFVAAACGGDDDTAAEGGSATTAAGAEAETEAANTDDGDCASEEVLCIGLVTDTGKVDDKSFNQSAWTGVQSAAKELDAVANFIETVDGKDYEANIGQFLGKDYDVIVTVGFLLGEATGIAAAANPEVSFIGVDQFQGATIDNVAGLIFPEDKAGFMAGALAGLLTNSNKVGAVLGTDTVPPVVAFKEGWEAGVKHTNPDVELVSVYHPDPNTAFNDPAFGASTARQQLDSGVDVIFGAGGKTGNGALIEVGKEEGAFCVGVDSDQWETVPEAHPCLVTSAMKLIDLGVADLIKLHSKGEFPGGNFAGQVGLAPYHDFDAKLDDEVKAKVAEVIDGINDGSIETGYTPGG